MQIPAGTVSTYSYMAQTIGNASATRAVASAIAKNPVSLLVPCHRVVPKSGGAGQYLWGVACKQQLLADEGVDYASVDCLKR
jgi:AraC family transcriptional regulator of adaptative response/methylated-DNA-[protein]-cysteine methyltransferase